MKKILPFILIISFSYSLSRFIDETSTEYSIGLNDKTGFFGLVNKSWIKEMVGGEKYITAGGLLFVGSMGYGEKYYLRRGKIFSPYISITGFGYYVLAIDGFGGVGISGNLGVDISAIKLWKNNELKLQFGLFGAMDPISGTNLVIPGEGGPSSIMPSFNIKLNIKK